MIVRLITCALILWALAFGALTALGASPARALWIPAVIILLSGCAAIGWKAVAEYAEE